MGERSPEEVVEFQGNLKNIDEQRGLVCKMERNGDLAGDPMRW